MKAVILAGGFGTRLRPLTCTRPKILFPIVNKPLLQWIFERLSASGADEAILAVNALTEFYIEQHRPPKCGLKVTFSVDPPRMPLGTAGPIKKAERLIGHESAFIIVNGDIYSDINYKEMLEAHMEKNALATIALCTVGDPSSFGVADVENNNCIKRFIEKPAKGQAPSNLINAGVYVLSPKVFDYIPEDRAVSMEREIFPKLVEERKLYGHFVNGLWMDIGRPSEYVETNKIVLDSIVNKKNQRSTVKFEIKMPVALDKGVFVEENSRIGPYVVLGKNVTVGRSVHMCDSVVFPEVKIEDSALVNGAIIGEGVTIGKQAKIGKGCMIGDYARVKDNVSLSDGSRVCPYEEVTKSDPKCRIIC